MPSYKIFFFFLVRVQSPESKETQSDHTHFGERRTRSAQETQKKSK